MTVAHELGKDLQEVQSWPVAQVYQWLAYLIIRDEREQQAIERARKASKWRRM